MMHCNSKKTKKTSENEDEYVCPPPLAERIGIGKGRGLLRYTDHNEVPAVSPQFNHTQGRGLLATRCNTQRPDPGPVGKPRRKAANNALNSIWNIPNLDSGSETHSSSSDISTTSNSTGDDNSASSSDESSECETINNNLNAESKLSETQRRDDWKKLDVGSMNRFVTGRVQALNVFKENPGLKASSKRKINTELDAFRLFINSMITQKVYQCTKNYGNENGALEYLTIEHFERFIGMQLARGLYGKHHSVSLLWSSEFGVNIFAKTMSRKQYTDIKRFLRFDVKQTRSTRIEADPFTHIREVFDEFTSNCSSHYIPHYSVCIDEQLMPLKCRCRFIIYMPNKPDKFGMKFWLLVDNLTKYVFNILPYLGGIEKASRMGEKLCDNVVNRLMRPIANKGYNITCDNFFTNTELAKSLQQKQTSIVGTLRQNSKGIPPQIISEKLQRHESCFYWNDSHMLLVKYQCKSNKSVFLLSTMHANPSVDTTPKRKPDVIHYYNHNKCGVDCADSMLRLYSSRCATRRWPVAVWENLLDIAVLNSWVCFKEASGFNISRKKFLMNLINQLVQFNCSSTTVLSKMPSAPEERTKCFITMCKNKSKIICKTCLHVYCGSHCPNPVEKLNLTVCEKCFSSQI
jgi:hypothetical protein